jgi:hypothetical protein
MVIDVPVRLRLRTHEHLTERRLHIIGRDRDNRIGTRFLSPRKERHRISVRFRGNAGDHRLAGRRCFDRNLDQPRLLVHCKRSRLAARGIDEQAVCALLDLPLDQFGISIVINCTAFEGRTSGVNAPVRNGTLRIIILAFSVGIKRRRYAQLPDRLSRPIYAEKTRHYACRPLQRTRGLDVCLWRAP